MEWFKKIIERAYDENGNVDIEILVKEFDKEFKQNAVVKIKYDELLAELEEKRSLVEEYEQADVEALRAEIDKLKEREKSLNKNYVIDLALVKAGARNLKAARALIELEEEFDEDMLNEHIKGLTQSEESSFLFSQANTFVGEKPDEGVGDFTKSFDEMSYSEMCAFMERND